MTSHFEVMNKGQIVGSRRTLATILTEEEYTRSLIASILLVVLNKIQRQQQHSFWLAKSLFKLILLDNLPTKSGSKARSIATSSSATNVTFVNLNSYIRKK